ncbi:MAG: DUF5615 family PIN-like protein [Chloroflexi bacterium]|nr:DUF5615 family PIN-like protein [Chloroflexota bacterium]
MLFLVDENLPSDVAQLLRGSGHDVLDLARSPHRGSTDRQVWELASRQRRIVVTRDLDFPLARLPQPPGVVLVRVPDTFTRSQIAGVMARFMASPGFHELVGRVTVGAPGRIRARSLP